MQTRRATALLFGLSVVETVWAIGVNRAAGALPA